jgi:type II secretory pathway pseudopilin PulG
MVRASGFRSQAGFSLLELMFAMTLTLIIGAMGFQLFRQNERVFREQNALAETQQNVRAMVFQLADEIRRAGQGVPVFASSFDTSPSEATVAVLSGSDATHLRVREGFSNIETRAGQFPSDYSLNGTRNVTVEDGSLFPAGTGRFVYIWGSGENGCWSWVRAELISVSTAAITIVPRQIGESCRTGAGTVRFTNEQIVALEECANVYFSAGSIWRATSTDMTSPSAPLWSAASELGRDLQGLSFTYYDRNGSSVTPASLAERESVARVDVTVRTPSGLSLSARGVPRNLGIR